VQGWRVRRPQRRWWAGALLVPLMLGRSSAAEVLAAAVSLGVLILVLVVATIALAAAFARSSERRRACLQTLQTLMRPSSWTSRR
jgi:hypothetical protein